MYACVVQTALEVGVKDIASHTFGSDTLVRHAPMEGAGVVQQGISHNERSSNDQARRRIWKSILALQWSLDVNGQRCGSGIQLLQIVRFFDLLTVDVRDFVACLPTQRFQLGIAKSHDADAKPAVPEPDVAQVRSRQGDLEGLGALAAAAVEAHLGLLARLALGTVQDRFPHDRGSPLGVHDVGASTHAQGRCCGRQVVKWDVHRDAPFRCSVPVRVLRRRAGGHLHNGQ
mmetsp:Transcript_13945/g.36029  ORF Transcript_13945/g.36029 Transcript_13945/m.36029 type:complete len:230 (-) Transcript_13945:448-1137(-)